MNADSADVWARRSCFRLELSRAGLLPDMYSVLGQNWGFPIYDWGVLEKEGFGFWTERLSEADKYYSCYRIDHVLGFFRIWALSERESTGAMGRFVPDIPISRSEPGALEFLGRPDALDIPAACAYLAACAGCRRVGGKRRGIRRPRADRGRGSFSI